MRDASKPSASSSRPNPTPPRAPNSAADASGELMDPSRWLEEYGGSLYSFAFHRLKHHELAEEAVQETLLSAIRRFHEYAGQASERTWLFAILRHKICDNLRRDAISKAKVSLDDEATPESLLFDRNGTWRAGAMVDVHGKVESRELRKIVFQCLRKLPRVQATIFMLRVMEERDTEEICKELDISINNFWTRLHRARLGLAKCVSESWPVDRGFAPS